MDQITILSLPLSIWKKIIHHYHKQLVVYGVGSAKSILKKMVCCKSASKHLNTLLDDNFFCGAVTGSQMSKYYFQRYLIS